MSTLKALATDLDITQQLELITEAMEQVGAATLMHTRQQILTSRPYFTATWEVYRILRQLVPKPPNVKNKQLVVVVTLNQGLHGSLLKKVVRVAKERAQSGDTDILVTGRKGQGYFSDYKDRTLHFFSLPNTVRFADFEPLREIIGGYVEVHIVYPRYLSAFEQEVSVVTLKMGDEKKPRIRAKTKEREELLARQYFIEPDVQQVVDYFNRTAVSMIVYNSFMESVVAYNAAQMIAMHSAHDNAVTSRRKLQDLLRKKRRSSVDQKLRELHRSFAKLNSHAVTRH